MTFGEITKEAIHRAMDNLRDVDTDLVDAQETRRVLDRLYGYEISPVLWRKVARGLSAGRVQSVVTRMVVDRERERMAFKSASYWDLTGQFGAGFRRSFKAKLAAVDGAKVASGRDFNDNGELTSRNAVHLNEELATALAAGAAERRLRASAPWTPSRTPAARRRRSPPRRCSRRPAASCASPPRAPCRWPSGSTKTATSPICVRTPPR